MISLFKVLKEKQLTYIVVLVLLLVLLAIGGVSGYFTGRWEWKQPPPVTTLRELRKIRKTGITIPGWQTVEQTEQQVGDGKWSLQIIKQASSQTQVILLLLPQNGPKDQPEVEWTEINGWGKLRWGKWDTAQYRSVEFKVKQSQNSSLNPEALVKARFFRVSTPQDTFAVLQWYAFRSGGDPSPLHWFFLDQSAQLQKHRIPWVAVSILIPMEPLGEVETTRSLAQSLGERVQTALMANYL
ncbi:cyanoexosortase B system-associated protein [Fortiea sp. LEGE XX443]|uniref:cyanoexosortase B system-associated protein n=1 Tax=Fortiea sp. LEGE XX443 TaxID=1828611 RepID=UPI001880D29D|nr:cyanoexosortase B system-associated protein [Fortiea sp. LEGE XX443]MBE9005904.1 cyanoexosortase B system-associated protein [Fortiea sp. LEGE XX443]